MKQLVAFCLVLTLTACAGVGEKRLRPGPESITAGMLLDASPLAGGAEPLDLSSVDVLELTPEMKAFVDDHVRGHQNEWGRLRMLLFAIMGEGTFHLQYDGDTRTAPETFRDRRGNCLSFTNMFIAMSRYVGLDARYQEVEIPPEWSLVGDSFLLSKHINVLVDLRHDDRRVVDFNDVAFNTAYPHEVISDDRARAHYFNNLGANFMFRGDTFHAFSYFRQSILQEDAFGPAWVNLGILYRREGYPEYAEAAYLQALEADRSDLTAMSNLASLYEEQGRTELAEELGERVRTHRMQNPYYRYYLAQTAFAEGAYETAIGHLKSAIRKRKDDDRFYSLMGLSYLMNGERESAQKWIEKAEAVAASSSDRQRYQHKLELLSNPPDGS